MKKAAIELSVSAIIVIIIAVVVLGLILAFTSGLFSQVGTRFEGEISKEPDAAIATAQNPLTISRENIKTHAQDDETLKISIHNPTNEIWDDVAPVMICKDEGVIDDYQVNNRTITPGETVSFNYIFKIGSLYPASYLCQIRIKSYSKDLSIDIVGG